MLFLHKVRYKKICSVSIEWRNSMINNKYMNYILVSSLLSFVYFLTEITQILWFHKKQIEMKCCPRVRKLLNAEEWRFQTHIKSRQPAFPSHYALLCALKSFSSYRWGMSDHVKRAQTPGERTPIGVSKLFLATIAALYVVTSVILVVGRSVGQSVCNEWQSYTE